MILSALLLLSTSSLQSDPLERLEGRVLQVGDRYLAVTPPELVTTGKVLDMSWSPDGRYLFVHVVRSRMTAAGVTRAFEKGEREPAETRTFIYSRETGKLNDLGRYNPTAMVSCTFIGANGWAMLTVEQDDVFTIYKVGAAPGNAPVKIGTTSVIGRLIGSPTTEMALFLPYAKGKGQLVTPAGMRELNCELPTRAWPGHWDKTGTMIELNTPRSQGEVRSTRKMVLRPLTDQVELVEGFEPFVGREGTSALELDAFRTGEHGILKLFPIAGELQSAAFAEVGRGLTFNSNFDMPAANNAIAFEANDAVFSCSVIPISKAAYERFEENSIKKKVIGKAKQAALGVMMYMSDMDDKFPPKDQFFDLIYPYVKNSEIVRDFVYTYSGPEEAGKIESPAETELGYVNGPGGRAVAYADGHVKWIPNK